MIISIDDAINAVSELAEKPMQGRPFVQRDFERKLPQTEEWDCDVLGDYCPADVRITLYIQAIRDAAELLNVSEDNLTMVVLLHELGHWFWHMVLDEDGNNWRDYGKGTPDCRETLAQLCVYYATDAALLKRFQEPLILALKALMERQSTHYQLEMKEHWFSLSSHIITETRMEYAKETPIMDILTIMQGIKIMDM